MTGFVYAIESGGAVKIGFAQDPLRRLAELNVGSPGRHRLLGFIEGTKSHERELHTLFRPAHVRGEWFRKNKAVRAFLSMLPPFDGMAAHKRRVPTCPAERIITKCGGAQRIADWLGIQAAAVHRWKYPPERGGTNGFIPSNRQQDLLDKAREHGIELSPADFFAPDPAEPERVAS
jgi:hypothetical protein